MSRFLGSPRSQRATEKEQTVAARRSAPLCRLLPLATTLLAPQSRSSLRQNWNDREQLGPDREQ